MSQSPASSRLIQVIRWTARIWSIPVILFALMRALIPDPSITEPVPASDWFLLSLWGVAILGLLIAWRWELVGGMLTIAIMFLREIFYVILRGEWVVNFLIIWVFVVPPAVLFLAVWKLENKTNQANPE